LRLDLRAHRAGSKRFYQLDDQDAPAAYAGRRSGSGTPAGRTIFVQSVAPED
jgi:hypothetical protein